jgi:Uma2 family endonuclease
MAGKLSVDEYLSGPAQLNPMELVWGVVREPPSPKFGHQATVGTVFYLLRQHVLQHDLGRVCLSPMDVVLDKARALVVQPDVFFVSNERMGIIREVVWGAPDLVIEVASRRSMLRDRTTKLDWYRRYGVLECWLIDPSRRLVVVADLKKRGRDAFRRFSRDESVKSGVLPLFDQPSRAFFE